MKKIKVSIIVPIYNVAPFLEDCLNSLLNQDIQKDEYEIICVNDGSKDNSLDILNEYANKYSCVKVITQENMGVSGARNTGIKESKGEYIWFVDGDDWAKPNCISEILNLMYKENASQCVFLLDGGTLGYQEDFSFKIDSYSVINNRTSTPSACRWFFNRSIIINNNLTFKLGIKYGEDTLFVCQYSEYIKNTKTVIINSEKPYYYRQNQGSAMNQKNRESLIKGMNDMIEIAKEYKQYRLKNTDSDFKKEVEVREGAAIAGALFSAARIKGMNVKELLKDLKSEGLYPYKLQFWTLKEKVGAKGKLLNIIKLLFPLKWYYLMVCAIFKITKKQV
ncbi:MAG: glycosyltransferase family 2 protein [Clostridia bacterium]|nr:glycosyltransferase family 2 protein [Clostridia bacterium]